MRFYFYEMCCLKRFNSNLKETIYKRDDDADLKLLY